MNKIKIKIKSPLEDNMESLNEFLETPLVKIDSAFFEEYGKLIKTDLSTGVLSSNFTAILLESERNFNHFQALYTIRQYYIKHFGFTLINEDFLYDISDYLKDKKVVEIGAGTGFLSKKLNDNGIQITAVDQVASDANSYGFQKNHFPIFIDSGEEYLKTVGKSFDTVLLSWPNYDTPFATSILQSMSQGQELIYIGEGYGGCTADDSFWDLLETKASPNEKATQKLKRHFASFPGIHDRPYVFNIL